MGGMFWPAVTHGHFVLRRLIFASTGALAELLERCSKLLGHEVVNDGVDGTVAVDAHPAEEQEPHVVVRRVDKGIDHDQRAIRHPE